MVTILLATLNGEDYLKAQLESIAAQTYENWQLVVGDDGSTDGTISILEEFSKQYPEQVTIIKNDPPQGSAKDNFISLIQNSYGPYFMFCDQDDVWKKNKMREIERVFEDPKVMAVVHDAQIVDEKLSSLDQTTFEWRNSGTGFWKNMKKNSYIGCCMAVRRSAMKRILPIPDDIWIHDQWIGLLSEQLGKVVFLEEPLIYYRRHGGNVTELTPGSITSMIKKRYHMIMGINHRVKEWSRHDKQNQRHTENS